MPDPIKVIIFDLKTAPRNFLAPVGDRSAYITAFVNELRDFGDLRQETFPLLWEILERMYRAVPPGSDCWPCLEDLRRVLQHEAEIQKRPNLLTAARAVQNLCAVLGDCARIRKPANLTESQIGNQSAPIYSGLSTSTQAARRRHDIMALRLVGADPTAVKWWMGMDFTQSLHGAEERGHTTQLNSAIIVDEVLNLYSAELFQTERTGIAALKRSITTRRFTGEAFLGGGQNYTGLAGFYSQNNGTILALQCNDAAEAFAVARAIGLPRERAGELQRLKKSECFVWSAGWSQPIKVTYPYLDFGDYPSAETVRTKQASDLAWIRSRNVYATYADPQSPSIDFLNLGSQSSPPTGTNKNAAAPLLSEHFAFLHSIRDHASDGLVSHYRRLNVSVAHGNKLLSELKTAGCILVNPVKSNRPTGGRARLVASLTTLGKQLLEAHENHPQRI